MYLGFKNCLLFLNQCRSRFESFNLISGPPVADLTSGVQALRGLWGPPPGVDQQSAQILYLHFSNLFAAEFAIFGMRDNLKI